MDEKIFSYFQMLSCCFLTRFIHLSIYDVIRVESCERMPFAPYLPVYRYITPAPDDWLYGAELAYVGQCELVSFLTVYRYITPVPGDWLCDAELACVDQ